MKKQAAHIFISLMPLFLCGFLYGVDPIPLSNADAISNLITVSSSGNYRVIEDLIYPILISVSDVNINLNRRQVSYNNSADSLITVTLNVHDVSIFNGSIQNTALLTTGTGSGVLVCNGASSIYLANLDIFNCGHGVLLAGQSGSAIAACQLNNLDCSSNTTGVSVQYANQTTVKNCTALNSSRAGFELVSCQANCLYGCSAIQTIGTTAVSGFKSSGGESNMFQRCVAKQTSSSSALWSDNACGFLLTGTEIQSKIIDCIVNDTTASSAAVTYGIDLRPVINSFTSQQMSVIQTGSTGLFSLWDQAISPDGKWLAECWFSGGTTVQISPCNNGALDSVVAELSIDLPTSVAWSPNGKYLAVGSLSCLSVFLFNGNSLTQVGSTIILDSVINAPVASIQWSPNGKFIGLSFGDTISSGKGGLYCFSFDGSGTPVQTGFQQYYLNTISVYPWTVSWAPDGSLLLLTGVDNGSTTNQYRIQVAAVSSAGALASVAAFYDAALFYAHVAGKFSPNGQYIAVVGYYATTYKLYLFQWTGSSLTRLTSAAVILPVDAGQPTSVTWSPDGKYIAVGCYNGKIYLYVFNGPSAAPTFLATAPNLGTGPIYALQWAPNGTFLMAGDFDSFNSMHAAYSVMTAGASNCLVDNCTVSDTTASNYNMGRGIVGAGSNIFTRNIATKNTINYCYGISNVYEGLFSVSENAVQPFDNISQPLA